MNVIMLQFLGGGALILCSAWLKCHDASAILRLGRPKSQKLEAWIRVLTLTALSFTGIACIVDPLIPGSGCLTVAFRSDHPPYPTLAENLKLRLKPIGFQGESGGNRVTYADFDSNGSAEVLADMSLLETRVTVEVFDVTQPSKIIQSATVYISPFVRRQLFCKKIVL
ncbi:MAG: hypothetical protein LAO20_18615 [Acidobacteriia bacterium]|nr:hypothetical protein [Terriglobia bacterium]